MEQEQTQGQTPPKKRRGGYRPNAGRPYKDGVKRHTTCIRLAEDLYAFLCMQPNKTDFIEEVLRFYLKEKGITL